MLNLHIVIAFRFASRNFLSFVFRIYNGVIQLRKIAEDDFLWQWWCSLWDWGFLSACCSLWGKQWSHSCLKVMLDMSWIRSLISVLWTSLMLLCCFSDIIFNAEKPFLFGKVILKIIKLKLSFAPRFIYFCILFFTRQLLQILNEL